MKGAKFSVTNPFFLYHPIAGKKELRSGAGSGHEKGLSSAAGSGLEFL
jgi:hypothetical protein